MSMFCIHITIRIYINMITKSQTLIGLQPQRIKISIMLHIQIFMKGSRNENLINHISFCFVPHMTLVS